jgi:hypothetical protein
VRGGGRRGAVLCLLAHLVAVLWVPRAEAGLERRDPGGDAVHAFPGMDVGVGRSTVLGLSRPSLTRPRLTVPVRQSLWYSMVGGGRSQAGTRPGSLSPLLARTANAPTYADSLRVNQGRRKRGGNTAGVLLSGLGIFAGVGLAAYFKSQADGYYNEYQVTADPEDAREAFDKAESYDRATLVGWVFAQLSFLSLIYFITKQSQRELIPVEGEPVVRPQDGGVVVGFRYTP